MNRKRFHLMPLVRGQIISGIRSGGYPHVAAEAWGMPREIFDAWLKRGLDPDAREPYRSLARDVCEAHAQARLRAEMEVFEAEPKLWLVHGPGREADDKPGWSVSVKPAQMRLDGHNALLDPELIQVFHTMLQVLMPFPEARAHVASALVHVGMDIAA